MSSTDKAQFWGYTLNNYSAEELLLIRQPPAGVQVIDHVYELEAAPTTGTPHVQGFAKLASQQRKSYVVRHWLPRATWIPLKSDEYRENMRKYVQKQDATATSAVRQTTSAMPLVYPALVPELLLRWIRSNTEEHQQYWRQEYRWIRDSHTTGETFEQWLREHKREYQHLSYGSHASGEEIWSWRGHEFNPRSEAPMEPLMDFARSQLVRTHRVETLVDRPEVRRATERYAVEILWRIEHTQDADPEAVPEEEDDDEAPPSAGPPDPGAEGAPPG